jgi:hypothetical protein
MGLIVCKECGHQVSDSAEKCPQCGARVQKSVGLLTGLVVVVIALSMVKCAVGGSSESERTAAKTPEQLELDRKKEEQFQQDVVLIKRLKATTKNPASFEVESILRLPSGVLCVTYRGTNSFGAVITEQTGIGRGGEIIDYRIACANQYGEDVTYVRRAL